MQLRPYQQQAISAPPLLAITYSCRKSLCEPVVKICCIEGCNNTIGKGVGGMCGMHSQRVRRYGDPNYTTPEAQRRANLRAAMLARVAEVKPTTYRKLHGRHEHRVIAEEMLGRPLQRNEIVHHIDGNKHNNDSSNLQVMTQSEHVRMHHKEMSAARKVKHGY